MTKTILHTAYILLICSMAAATVIEKATDTATAHATVYSSWWFILLWALLAGAGCAHILRRRLNSMATLLLHLSFVIILCGALVTRLCAGSGTMRMACGEPASIYTDANGNHTHTLPFAICTDSVFTTYHPGTDAASDYCARVSYGDPGHQQTATLSMNNILKAGGYRFYLQSIDANMQGCTLSVKHDPWGIAITYTGYALLFISFFLVLASPGGRFRHLLRTVMRPRAATIFTLLIACGIPTKAAPSLPEATAHRLGQLLVLHNGRICPMQTMAIDFTGSLSRGTSYNGYSAEQVMAGFMFWPSEWSAEPLLHIKRGAMRTRLQLDSRVSVNTFFNKEMGGYILGPYLHNIQQGLQGEPANPFLRQVDYVDRQLQQVMKMQSGRLLCVFPITDGRHLQWMPPTEIPAGTLTTADSLFVARAFSLMAGEARAGNYDAVDTIIGRIALWQQHHAGASLPSPAQIRAENIYNNMPGATGTALMFMAATMLFVLCIAVNGRSEKTDKAPCSIHNKAINALCRAIGRCQTWAITAGLILLLVIIALRWIICSAVPLASGYDTMLFLSSMVMVAAVAFSGRWKMLSALLPAVSGLFMLVAGMGGGGAMGQAMPVLRSPLLSVHVSIIMLSYALLTLSFVISAYALVAGKTCRNSSGRLKELSLASELLIHPALCLLSTGIFVGAVWANISWGTYWSWDPKETWALITLMVYAVSIHSTSVRAMRRPMVFHCYVVAAYASLLITYFGVNMLLGGMHSYA